MILKPWEELPKELRTEEVRPYYEILQKKKNSLYLKRAFDICASCGALAVLSPAFIALSIAIKLDSEGPIFFRQTRVTQYGKKFSIYKFRTMINDAEEKGSQVTVENDVRITKVGNIIRKFRLDEIPQLINIIKGEMTFVGTRPEVEKYVERYSPEMMATLLLPAGVTSLASILYKDEAELLKDSDNADFTYVNDILPDKMKYNLQSIKNFSVFDDVKILFKTVEAVLKD